MSRVTWISVKVPGHERFQVWFKGVQVQTLDVLEAKENGDHGFIVHQVFGLEGEPIINDDGSLRTRVEFGRVEIREIPKSDLGGIVRLRL